MGNVSDRVGRKPVVMACLVGTFLSHYVVSRSTTLLGVMLGRIIGGIMGGMTPIAQAAVADVVPVEDRPKFLGRIQACVGAGFVLGPVVMTLLHKLLNLSTRQTFVVAMAFPTLAMVIAVMWLEETKGGNVGVGQLLVWGQSAMGGVHGKGAGGGQGAARMEAIPKSVLMLVGNGFLLMYAFSIETVYAMFLKDNFGYGESVLSMIFALNGIAVGALQLLGMKHLVALLGKHMMLITGNLLLAVGMVGLAFSRVPGIHFLV
ncbi:unnamed protein product, partial [Discosporangium mesarthrocarpum]